MRRGRKRDTGHFGFTPGCARQEALAALALQLQAVTAKHAKRRKGRKP